MEEQLLPVAGTPLYRVDRFTVPALARDEFLQKVRATHTILRRQPGFLRDAILERDAGLGVTAIVTIVEWNSAAAIEQARAVVGSEHRRMQFNPQETIARLSITADIGLYNEARD